MTHGRGLKPLLLLDVDGPLNPWRAKRTPVGYEEHIIDGFTVRLNPEHGPMLLRAAYRLDLMWCTTWNEDANVKIAPRLGLPRLPVLHLVGPPEPSRHFVPRPIFWKLDQVLAQVGSRPFAWLDDKVSRRERAMLDKGTTCLRFVDPGKGLTQGDLDVVLQWAAELSL